MNVTNRLWSGLVLLTCASVTVQLAIGQESGQSSFQTATCTAGFAGVFSCSGVDLMALVPKEMMGGANGSVNDVWGWTDPVTDREYALVGLSEGTSFVDVTNPSAPIYLGILPTQSFGSAWRDIKVYSDHAFVVAEASNHGVQVFDLTRLRDVPAGPATFTADAVYFGVGSAHNIVVNEESGFAYAVGSRGGDILCGPGLHMIDVRVPKQPRPAGCFAHTGTGRGGSGYTHDAQCVIYRGPDGDYRGREICIAANENFISIADVTDKSAPRIISSATYPTVAYAHQGWLTGDYRYFLQNDELDELRGLVFRTTTQIWDIADLDAPVLHGNYLGPTAASDHNLYVVNDWAYMANYRAGLQVVDFTDIDNPVQVAFFDTFTENDLPATSGAWSVYPFFRSRNVVVSAIEDGLFILSPPFNSSVDIDDEQPDGNLNVSVYPNPFASRAFVRVRSEEAADLLVLVFDLLGREVAGFRTGPLPAGSSRTFTLDATALAAGRYVLQVRGADELHSRLLTIAG